MDLYVLLKFAHVASAIVWLGGGFTLVLLAFLFAKRPNPADLLGVIRLVAFLGPRLFLPTSILTLLTGLATTYVGGFGWPAWVVLGLAGIAVTALVGAIKLGPTCENAIAISDTKGVHAARHEMLKLLPLARFDYTTQFVIVFLMITKPDWQDVPVLAGLAMIVVMALVAAFQPAPRSLKST
ncbi:DUF2269 family protein [Tabrizicola sp.]|uniref:DUF2269 family protein n=1 Tax=Tabrizicola sp. TaxID=2005166 RepID=UPI00286D2369|nr:DUF2269 family protein [Tabrizicola sp.]